MEEVIKAVLKFYAGRSAYINPIGPVLSSAVRTAIPA